MIRLAFLSFLGLTAPAAAAEDQPLQPTPRQVREDDLRREVSGSTISGRHANGMPFSEYHAPDGKIYGHNNNDPVRFGCWRVVKDQVCYNYEGGNINGTFCWTFFRAQGGYTLYLPESGTVGTAKREAGNPYGWNDGGKPWECNLMSMR